MSRMAIVTDSIVGIPERLLQELKIHTVPYYIHRGSEVLRDLVTIDRDSFYKWLPTCNPATNDRQSWTGRLHHHVPASGRRRRCRSKLPASI